MNQATQFLINQKVQHHQSDLRQWAGRVEQAREPLDAFRLAGQRPNPDSLISSLRSLYAGDRTRVDSQVERARDRHVEKLPGDDLRVPQLLRFAQGHWPKIHRAFEQKARMARAQANATLVVEAQAVPAEAPREDEGPAP